LRIWREKFAARMKEAKLGRGTRPESGLGHRKLWEGSSLTLLKTTQKHERWEKWGEEKEEVLNTQQGPRVLLADTPKTTPTVSSRKKRKQKREKKEKGIKGRLNFETKLWRGKTPEKDFRKEKKRERWIRPNDGDNSALEKGLRLCHLSPRRG